EPRRDAVTASGRLQRHLHEQDASAHLLSPTTTNAGRTRAAILLRAAGPSANPVAEALLGTHPGDRHGRLPGVLDLRGVRQDGPCAHRLVQEIDGLPDREDKLRPRGQLQHARAGLVRLALRTGRALSRRIAILVVRAEHGEGLRAVRLGQADLARAAGGAAGEAAVAIRLTRLAGRLGALLAVELRVLSV